MMKKTTSGFALILSTIIFGQVGIQTDTPHPSSDLELGSANKTLYLNRVANPATDIASPQPGMILYDTTLKCLRAFQGNPAGWSDCLGSSSTGGSVGSISGLTCTSAVFAPSSAVVGQAYSGTLTVPYTGGNGGAYVAQSFSENGLTFTLPAGNFQTGNGNLVYNITGTPTTAGTINLNIYQYGGSCTGLSLPVQAANALTCGSAAFLPATATYNTAYSGTLTIPYTNGNGAAYAAQSFTQNGLIFTLPAGNFLTGNGNLVYNITGTPNVTGSISVNITASGQTCNGSILPVNQNGAGVLTSSITLSQSRTHYIASVYDTDYLPYATPTAAASTAVLNADGTPEAIVVNYQGYIDTTGVTVQIPVTATGSGSVGAWTNTFTVPAMYAEDGISRALQLSWSSQSYTSATKYITATIKSLGGTFNAKKLDINAGIGNDYLGILLGAFQYPYNSAGTLTSYQVRDIPGIPDRMFGLADNAGDTNSHLMLYLPVQGDDGKIWLNNNLGADYSNLNHASFNPAQQATSGDDYHAFGSLFQWGRKPDGHELHRWVSPTGAAPIHPGMVQTRSDNPTHPTYIGNVADWRINTSNTLWATESSANNSCPRGFRVPTYSELYTVATAAGSNMINSNMKFTYAGMYGFFSYGYNTQYVNQGSGYYWTSNINTAPSIPQVTYVVIVPNGSGSFYDNPSLALSVRCIKN